MDALVEEGFCGEYLGGNDADGFSVTLIDGSFGDKRRDEGLGKNIEAVDKESWDFVIRFGDVFGWEGNKLANVDGGFSY